MIQTAATNFGEFVSFATAGGTHSRTKGGATVQAGLAAPFGYAAMRNMASGIAKWAELNTAS